MGESLLHWWLVDYHRSITSNANVNIDTCEHRSQSFENSHYDWEHVGKKKFWRDPASPCNYNNPTKNGNITI